jgi:hypothetical protein
MLASTSFGPRIRRRDHRHSNNVTNLASFKVTEQQPDVDITKVGLGRSGKAGEAGDHNYHRVTSAKRLNLSASTASHEFASETRESTNIEVCIKLRSDACSDFTSPSTVNFVQPILIFYSHTDIRYSIHKYTPPTKINMQYTVLALLATTVSLASAQTSSASASPSQGVVGQIIPVGGNCVPNGTPCALGANCYAVNSMLQPVCGNFQASCTSDQQCAFNTCNGGLCNGFLPSSAASSASPIITPASSSAGGFQPRPSSTVTAGAGTLPLGAECNPSAAQSQCIAGVSCYASNSGLIPRCGNFNAACTGNSQCAYNSCNNGLCNGLPISSSANNGTAGPSSASGSASMTASRSATGTGYVPASRTSTMTMFTGAAAVATMVPEVMAVMLGVAVWAM